jgi:hypothetical protein
MARKMKKFSAGGAQGRYERRMADIEKDYAKAAARKTGKAAEVAEAKRQQRIADAKDDLAKRTGADRTATRAAEKAAESNLTKTRKYGAVKSAVADTAGPTGKITDTLGALTAPKSGLATAAKKPVQKSVQKPVAAAPQAKAKDRYYVSPENRKAIDAAAKKEPVSKFDKAAFSDLKTGKNSYGAANIGKPAPAADKSKSRASGVSAALLAPKGSTSRSGSLFGSMFKTSDAFRKSQEAKYGKAKGGTVKKESTMNKKPMPMGGKQLMPMKKKPTKEPITGGADTVPLTPGRKEFLKELAKRNAKPGMAKGGKATKFGAAMVKKSADTKGRAMVKKAGGGKCYASGGLVAGHKSADGIAKKGKTKASMVKMARGGAAQMRSRDSYGGANFKKGGSC